MDKYANIGSVIRCQRMAAGLSVRELARRMFVSHSYLSLVEHGKRNPGDWVVEAAADALGISPDRIFWDVQENGGNKKRPRSTQGILS